MLSNKAAQKTRMLTIGSWVVPRFQSHEVIAIYYTIEGWDMVRLQRIRRLNTLRTLRRLRGSRWVRTAINPSSMMENTSEKGIPTKDNNKREFLDIY